MTDASHRDGMRVMLPLPVFVVAAVTAAGLRATF
jgi:hypothetical protein